jgi:preprotein translocase SecE subunit
MSVAAAAPLETKATPVSLWTASLMGGVYVLGVIAVVFYGVPALWHVGVSSWLAPATAGTFVDPALMIIADLAALALLVVFGMNLMGPHPLKGIRGGIFLGIASIFTGCLLVQRIAAVIERGLASFDLGKVLSFIGWAFCAWLFWKFIKSDRMPRWAVALESAGWFDAKSYKRNQGVRVRRLTILGLLLLLGSGVYTMMHNHVIGEHDGHVAIPFTNVVIQILPNPQFMIPVLLCGLALWFSWRVVNYPTFADFLVATEAEINKVSWTPRARLIQDTIVVLITVFIITLFLFVVDVFWGYFLSRSFIGVLPSDEELGQNKPQQVNTTEW